MFLSLGPYGVVLKIFRMMLTFLNGQKSFRGKGGLKKLKKITDSVILTDFT